MVAGGPPAGSLKSDKDAVNCGTKVCGAAEQCCVRQPLEPYCAAKGATCDCAGPTTSTTDAGKDGGGKHEDASTDASKPGTDSGSGGSTDAATKG
jgi:hypothetical protein